MVEAVFLRRADGNRQGSLNPRSGLYPGGQLVDGLWEEIDGGLQLCAGWGRWCLWRAIQLPTPEEHEGLNQSMVFFISCTKETDFSMKPRQYRKGLTPSTKLWTGMNYRGLLQNSLPFKSELNMPRIEHHERIVSQNEAAPWQEKGPWCCLDELLQMYEADGKPICWPMANQLGRSCAIQQFYGAQL